jgi:hypothetical protein
MIFNMILFVACGGGGGGSSTESSSDAQDNNGSIQLNSDNTSSHIAKVISPDSTEIDLWVDKEIDGTPKYSFANNVRFRFQNGTTAFIQFDEYGRPIHYIDPNGYGFIVNEYIDENTSDITFYRPDGYWGRGVINHDSIPSSPIPRGDNAFYASTISRQQEPYLCPAVDLTGDVLCHPAVGAIVSIISIGGCSASVIGDLVLAGPTGEAVLGCAVSGAASVAAGAFLCSLKDTATEIECPETTNSINEDPLAPILEPSPDLTIDLRDRDNDGDGFTENQGDIDDLDPNVYPGSQDVPEEDQDDLNAGLIAYYQLNNNTNDSSGNNQHGSVFGTTQFTTDRFGNANGAIYLNGISHIEVPHDEIQNINDNTVSLSVWVKHGDLTIQNSSIVSKILGHDIAYNVRVIGRTEEPDEIWFTGECGNTNWGATGDPITSDTWYNITAVRDGGNVYLYVDGILVKSEATGLCTNSNTSPIYIGISTASDAEGFLGAIDDVRIYNRALTQSEVTYISNN